MSTKPGPQSYYDILGISPSASPEAIDQAYRARVREVRDLPGGGDRTHQLTIAYRALKGAEKRKNYDAALGGSPPARAVPKSAFIASGAAGAAMLAPRSAAGSGGVGVAPPATARNQAEVPPAPAPGPVEPRPEPVAEAASVSAPAPLPERAPVHEEVAFYADQPAPYPDEPAPAVHDPDPEREREPAWAAPAAAYHEEIEHERPARRRTGLYALAALIGVGLLALLLLVGRNSGPDSERRASAQADAGSALSGDGTQPSTAGESASAAPPAEGGLLAEIFGTEEPAADPATAAAPATLTPDGQGEAVAGAIGAGGAENGITEEQIEVAGASEDTPAAEAPQEPERTAAATPPPPPPPAAARVSRASAARYLGGGLVDADNAGGRFAGSVGVRFTVLPNGRTGNCRVTRSSGNPGLDGTTCNLLQQRLRFVPATNDDGQAVASEVGSVYTWGRTPGRPR